MTFTKTKTDDAVVELLQWKGRKEGSERDNEKGLEYVLMKNDKRK